MKRMVDDERWEKRMMKRMKKKKKKKRGETEKIVLGTEAIDRCEERQPSLAPH